MSSKPVRIIKMNKHLMKNEHKSVSSLNPRINSDRKRFENIFLDKRRELEKFLGPGSYNLENKYSAERQAKLKANLMPIKGI